jgi:hypothetical protein
MGSSNGWTNGYVYCLYRRYNYGVELTSVYEKMNTHHVGTRDGKTLLLEGTDSPYTEKRQRRFWKQDNEFGTGQLTKQQL